MSAQTKAWPREPSLVWLGGVILYVVLGPTQAPFYTPSLYDNSRLLQLFLLCALASIALVIPPIRGEALSIMKDGPSPMRWGVVILGIVAVGSASQAALPGMALQEVALLVLLGFLLLSAISLVAAFGTVADWRLLAAFEGSALVFTVVFWMACLAARESGQAFEWIHPFVTFANVRHFSQFQAYTLPLLVVPVAYVGIPLRWRVAAYLLSAHWWALQFAVGTRAVWFACGCSAVLLLLVLRRDALVFLKWMCLCIAGGALVYLSMDAFLLADAPGLAEMGRRGFDASKRGELWASALAMVWEAPLLGVGPMHFSFRNFEWAAHPHNTMLQVAAEYGLLAATIACGLVAYLLWSCASWVRSASVAHDRLINIALLTALLMGFLDALVSGNTLMPVSQTILFLLMGWVIGRNRPVAWIRPTHLTARTGLLLSAVVLASMYAVGQGALDYYRYWDARQFMVPAGVSHPRYWEEGHWPAVSADSTARPIDPLG